MFTTTIFIPVITALVEAVKRTFKLDARFLPILSVVFGILIAFLVQGQTIFGLEIEAMTIQVTIFAGVILGLTASGLYSGFSSLTYVAKTISNKIKKTGK